jgi:site-specific recombinase XerD
MADRGLAAGTRRIYLSRIRHLLLSIGHHPARVGPAEICQYLRHVSRSSSCSEASLNQRLSAIRFLFRHVHHRPEILEALRGGARGLASPLPALRVDDIARLMRRTEPGRNRVLIALLYGSGLRLEEALHIRVGDIDLRQRTVRVVSRRGGTSRISVIARALLPDVWNLMRDRPATEHLLADRHGQVIGPRGAQKVLGRAGRRAGIPVPITPRLLRHTFAEHLLDGGVHPSVVRSLLGQDGVGDRGSEPRLPPGARSPI